MNQNDVNNHHICISRNQTQITFVRYKLMDYRKTKYVRTLINNKFKLLS